MRDAPARPMQKHPLTSRPCTARRWDRAFVDETNDETDVYDKGAPDYQTGEKKDLKWRLVRDGVEALVRDKGLRAEDVVLWSDWQVCAAPLSNEPPLCTAVCPRSHALVESAAHASRSTKTSRRRSSRAS